MLPLFGDLSAAEQDAALRPGDAQHRKVVLATNIAETSLTIEGVRVVVDSGLARRARFDPATGMSGLETVRISRASADQRRGRAGRLGPGVCYRLWSESEHASLARADRAGNPRSRPRARRARARGVGRERSARVALARSAAVRDVLAGAGPVALARCDRRRRSHHGAWPRAGSIGHASAARTHDRARGRARPAAPRAGDRRSSGRTRSAALERWPARRRFALANRGSASRARRRSARRGRRSGRRRRAPTRIAQRRRSRTAARSRHDEAARRGDGR